MKTYIWLGLFAAMKQRSDLSIQLLFVFLNSRPSNVNINIIRNYLCVFYCDTSEEKGERYIS